MAKQSKTIDLHIWQAFCACQNRDDESKKSIHKGRPDVTWRDAGTAEHTVIVYCSSVIDGYSFGGGDWLNANRFAFWVLVRIYQAEGCLYKYIYHDNKRKRNLFRKDQSLASEFDLQ